MGTSPLPVGGIARGCEQTFQSRDRNGRNGAERAGHSAVLGSDGIKMSRQDNSPPLPADDLDSLLSTASGDDVYTVRTRAPGPAGALPLDESMLRNWASGDLFGLSQDAGMGWEA